MPLPSLSEHVLEQKQVGPSIKRITVTADKVLVAAKVNHKGLMFRAAAYGNTTIALSDEFSLGIVKTSEDFIEFQLFRHGIGSSPKTQSWSPKPRVAKPKKVAKKKVVKEKPKKKEMKLRTGVLEI